MDHKKKSITRRSFLTMTGITTAGAMLSPKTAVFAKAVEAQPPSLGATSLAGTWRFALDRSNAGVSAGWFTKPLAAHSHISLPGILQTQGFGDEITAETEFVAALPPRHAMVSVTSIQTLHCTGQRSGAVSFAAGASLFGCGLVSTGYRHFGGMGRKAG